MNPGVPAYLRRVADLVRAGMSTEEIARELNVTAQSAAVYVSSARKVFGLPKGKVGRPSKSVATSAAHPEMPARTVNFINDVAALNLLRAAGGYREAIAAIDGVARLCG